MLAVLKELAASLLESLRQPLVTHECDSQIAGCLEFRFTHDSITYTVTVYCNRRMYLLAHYGVLRYRRRMPIYEVHSIVGGPSLSHDLKGVFSTQISFPALRNRWCSPKQQAIAAIDAYISVICQRFKEIIDKQVKSKA